MMEYRAANATKPGMKRVCPARPLRVCRSVSIRYRQNCESTGQRMSCGYEDTQSWHPRWLCKRQSAVCDQARPANTESSYRRTPPHRGLQRQHGHPSAAVRIPALFRNSSNLMFASANRALTFSRVLPADCMRVECAVRDTGRQRHWDSAGKFLRSQCA